MENSEKGSKRKCTKCGTLFFDFGKFPLSCPSCGAELNSLLTNISKRGRPPKIADSGEVSKNKNVENDMEIANIAVEEQSEDSVAEEEISSVDDIVEIERNEE